MNQQTISYLKIASSIFLACAILLLAWQFIKADKIAKDIALSTDPTEIIRTYEQLTGHECICGYDISNRIRNIKTSSNQNPIDINFSLISAQT